MRYVFNLAETTLFSTWIKALEAICKLQSSEFDFVQFNYCTIVQFWKVHFVSRT